MITHALIVSFVGGILCLDRVFVQAMVSRPIVAAPVIGVVLGDPCTGLIAGAFIELLWIDQLPIGTRVLPNDTIAAILIAASAIESGRILGYLPQGLIALSVLMFVPFAVLVQKLDFEIIRGNEKLARAAASDAALGDTGSVSRNHMRAVLKGWLAPTVVILLCFPLGVSAVTWVHPRLAPWAVRGLDLLYVLIPLIGAAVALNTVNVRGKFPIFCAVFLAATVVLSYVR